MFISKLITGMFLLPVSLSRYIVIIEECVELKQKNTTT